MNEWKDDGQMTEKGPKSRLLSTADGHKKLGEGYELGWVHISSRPTDQWKMGLDMEREGRG
jgi:hypothetical protein